MRQFLGPFLAIVLIVSTLVGMIAWMSAINPREPALGWGLRIATAILFPASLIALVALALRKESVPDFLSKLRQPRMGRGGVIFAFDCIVRDGWASIEIHYQNRFSNPANVFVTLAPSRSFTMTRNRIEPVAVQFVCGPAAYGIIHLPVGLRREYQGQVQSFDVAEQTEYPQGTGAILRNVVGPKISSLNFSELKMATVALARLALGEQLVTPKFQSRVKLWLPKRVSEPSKVTPPITQEELWTLSQSDDTTPDEKRKP
jgi:hypothetical protein